MKLADRRQITQDLAEIRQIEKRLTKMFNELLKGKEAKPAPPELDQSAEQISRK